jgi:hypothetical protein
VAFRTFLQGKNLKIRRLLRRYVVYMKGDKPTRFQFKETEEFKIKLAVISLTIFT